MERQTDRYGRPVPDRLYHTKDFERTIALRQRTRAIARHLSDFLHRSDRFAKTIVFCVDQEHASAMRQELLNLNSDLVAQHPHWVCRVTSDEGDIGLMHLADFQDIDKPTPTILTTSHMLSTGVDAEMVKNIAIVRIVGSQTEFKQIIGRGTRLRVDYGKEWFNIIDYTGTATQHFADPDFDGEPECIDETTIDENGQTTEPPPDPNPEPQPPCKYYIDGGQVQIMGHLVYDLDAQGKQLHVVRYTEYTGRPLRPLSPTREPLRSQWANPDTRTQVRQALTERGIHFDALLQSSGQGSNPSSNPGDIDPFDLLCHLAWNTPMHTRRQRGHAAKQRVQAQLAQYSSTAREILTLLLDYYTERGILAFDTLSELMKIQPFERYGTPPEIAERHFGGIAPMRHAIAELQSTIYAQ